MMKSINHTTMGEMEEAAEFHRKALGIANESNRPFDRVGAGYSGGYLALGHGNPVEAAATLGEALAIAQKHGIRLFTPILACYLGVAHLQRGMVEAAQGLLVEAREEAKSLGYTSMILRSSIYLALALSRLGDGQTALNMLREARNTARQQGFAGLEAEALFGEASAMPRAREEDRIAILAALRATIAIASECGAKPLLARAEALLNEMRSQTA
jgi:tetratricopeptide (TPR) repeat protein